MQAARPLLVVPPATYITIARAPFCAYSPPSGPESSNPIAAQWAQGHEGTQHFQIADHGMIKTSRGRTSGVRGWESINSSAALPVFECAPPVFVTQLLQAYHQPHRHPPGTGSVPQPSQRLAACQDSNIPMLRVWVMGMDIAGTLASCSYHCHQHQQQGRQYEGYC